MNTKVKGNNKGFSLVELIVVMAIMAILAVTLTPKLSQYIDKARQTNDREAVNAVYTAIKLGMMDDAVYAIPKTSITDPTTPAPYVLELVTDAVYTRGATPNFNVWTPASLATLDLFESEIAQTLGAFKFQSTRAGANTEIKVTVTSANLFTVQLDYEGDGTYDYTVDSSAVAVN